MKIKYLVTSIILFIISAVSAYVSANNIANIEFFRALSSVFSGIGVLIFLIAYFVDID